MSNLLATGVILLQVSAGVVIWLVLLGRYLRSLLLTLGMGIALGTFLSMISSVLIHGSVFESVAWALPSILAVVLAALNWSRLITSLQALTFSRSEVAGLGITLFIGGVIMVVSWIRTPLSVIAAGGSVDMYFFEAISHGIANFGPAESILMSGGSLRYHWFTYAWAGELSAMAGLDNFVAITRFLPSVTLIAVALLAVGWAASMKFGGRRSPAWVPALSGLLVIVGGYTGALYGVILNFDSPSQAMSTIWLLALAVVFTTYLLSRETSLSRGSHGAFLAIIAILTVATMGGKASTSIVAIAGIGFTAIIGLISRSDWAKRAIIASLVSITFGAVTYLLVLSGVSINDNLTDAISVRASTWQQLDPVIGRWAPVLGTLALLLAVFARLGGLAWLGANRRTRRSPEVLFSIGAVLISVIALIVLRGGINDLWFLLAASAPAAIVSAYGVGQASARLTRPLLIAAVFIAIAASLVSLLLSLNWEFDQSAVKDSFFAFPGVLFWLAAVTPWLVVALLAAITLRLRGKGMPVRSVVMSATAITVIALTLTSLLTRPAVVWTQSRQSVTDIGVVTPTPASDVLATNSSGESPSYVYRADASVWLKNNTAKSDLIATSAPGLANIPALTGRQMYLAGSVYQLGLGNAAEADTVVNRSTLSTSLATSEWPIASAQMCAAGVDWFWIEGADQSLYEKKAAFSSSFISIYSSASICE
jgi:hypothetical protein